MLQIKIMNFMHLLFILEMKLKEDTTFAMLEICNKIQPFGIVLMMHM